MFDKTVLCTAGDQQDFLGTGSSLHQLLRNKQVTLTEGSVQVCFLTGNKPDQSDLRSLAASVSGDGKSISVSSKSTWRTDNGSLVILNCKFSMLSELHVVAWGDEFKGGAEGGGSAQAPTGYCVVVIVSGRAFIAALSDEVLTCNEKLKMTFDIEETNGVLQAKADFDGTITQGIFDKLHDYETLVNKPQIPEVGDGKVTMTVLTGAVGLKTEGAHTSVEPMGSAIVAQEFTVNQSGASSLYLGAAALKGVDTAIASGGSESNVPTSSAVASYVKDTPVRVFVNQTRQSVYDPTHGIYTVTPTGTFTLNEALASGAEYIDIDLGLGTAAGANVVALTSDGGSTETIDTVTGQDNHLITLEQAKSLVQSGVGNGTITVLAGATQGSDAGGEITYTGGDTVGTFTVNQSGNTTLNLGAAAMKAVDSSITANSASENLPTSSAVASFVKDATLTVYPFANDSSTVASHTFSANASNDVSMNLGLKTAASLDYASSVIDTDSDKLPTSSAVASYVTSLGYITSSSIGNGKLSIKKHTTDTATEFYANQATDSDVSLDLALGTAADANVVDLTPTVAESGETVTPTIDTVTGQDSNLITLGQAKTLAQNATAPKTATVTTSGSTTSVNIPVGSLVWLAINFIGSVNLTSFTTKASETTDAWGGGVDESYRNAATYIAKLNDHNGDFFKSDVQVPAGYKFRTLNAMEVTGESMPCYGYALCMCIEAPSA